MWKWACLSMTITCLWVGAGMCHSYLFVDRRRISTHPSSCIHSSLQPSWYDQVSPSWAGEGLFVLYTPQSQSWPWLSWPCRVLCLPIWVHKFLLISNDMLEPHCPLSSHWFPNQQYKAPGIFRTLRKTTHQSLLRRPEFSELPRSFGNSSINTAHWLRGILLLSGIGILLKSLRVH